MSEKRFGKVACTSVVFGKSNIPIQNRASFSDVLLSGCRMQQVVGDQARLGGHHDSAVDDIAFGPNQESTSIDNYLYFLNYWLSHPYSKQ